jgi:hypothetical protein
MSDKTVNGYTIRTTKREGLGSTWVVRVYRNRFPFKKSVSSDWFLDGRQAEDFAAQITAELGSGAGLENVRDRKPGWTLHRPLH